MVRQYRTDHEPAAELHRLAKNVISASGYNGRGIAPGTALGRMLARYVLGEIADADLPLPLSDPEPVRYRALKEACYEAGAQIAHMAAAHRYRVPRWQARES